MRKLLIGLFIILLPSVSLAASSITKYSVGTCKQINGEYYQQMPDGTWAAPGDNLNTCGQNNNIWTFNNLLGYGYNNYNNYGNYNQYSYNQQLANMSNSQWLINCILLNSLLSQSNCQGYNPQLSSYYNSGLSNYLQYPSLGRNYVSVGGDNYNVSVSTDEGSFWKNALIGVGMGWLLDRLTS